MSDFDFDWDNRKAMRNTWTTGIVLSTACLIIQLILYKYVPKIRKTDQMVLTQLTIARLLNTTVEFLLTFDIFNAMQSDILWGMLTHSEAVTICWMCVYTKILYDKFVIVLGVEDINFKVLSCLIWLLTIPLGALDPVLATRYYEFFLFSYTWVKLGVLTVNMYFFFKIYNVILDVKMRANSKVASIVVSSVISFILFCITSFGSFVSILMTDVVPEYSHMDQILDDGFLIMNSFAGIAITVIFVIRTKTQMKER